MSQPTPGRSFRRAVRAYFMGAASAFNLAGTARPSHSARMPAETDARAISEDWRAVGGDMRAAIKQWQGRSQ